MAKSYDLKLLRLLLTVGSDPTTDKSGLIDRFGRSIGQKLYKARERGMIIKTMLDEDRAKGLRWELTGKGEKHLRYEIGQLRKTLPGVQIEVAEELHVYRPPHVREQTNRFTA